MTSVYEKSSINAIINKNKSRKLQVKRLID